MKKGLSKTMVGWLGHVRAANERGMGLSAYAQAKGLSASGLYQAKSQLMKVGAWPRPHRRKGSATKAKPSEFVAVHVASPMGCRLSHVSGWSIECDALPSTTWLNELLRGSGHAS
jgi:hypothetical protein